jgi:hypothetical protein
MRVTWPPFRGIMSEQRTGFKVTPTPRPGESELTWYEWLMVFGVIVGAVLLCAFGGRAMLKARPGSAAIVIATPTLPPVPPTRTPLPPTPTATSTPQPTASPTPGVIAIGTFVQVVLAGPQGLSFRQEPGLQTGRIKYLPEGTVLRVIDGPRDADGLVWWKLQSNTDANDTGWAAADYLALTTP